jgi:hypothetical protein
MTFLKNDVNVTFKFISKKLGKKLILVAIRRSLTKISGSVSQRYGSADSDLDPDPYQNVTDLQHWLVAWQWLKNNFFR